MWYLVLSHSLPEKEEMKQRNYDDHRDWLETAAPGGTAALFGPDIGPRLRDLCHAGVEPE